MTVSACGLFEKKQAPEPAPAPKVVAAVPYATLAAALPKALPDWTAEPPRGGITNTGAQELSRASVNFKKDVDGKQGSLSIEIIDGTHVPSVKSRLALMTHPADDVHLMDLTVAGYHGLQQWQPLSGGAFGFLVIADRFLVMLNGSNVSPTVFRQAAESVDVRQLESLVGATPVTPASPQPSSPAAAVTTADTAFTQTSPTAAASAVPITTATSVQPFATGR